MRRLKVYIILHFLMAAFSFAPVCSKLAGRHAFLSWGFIFYYGLSLLILFIYAFGWQQVIRRMPLTAAYANKAVTVVWGMLWGALIFSERLSAQKLFGTAVIVAGIALYAFFSREEQRGGETT